MGNVWGSGLMTYSIAPQAEESGKWTNRKVYLAIAGVVVFAAAVGAMVKLTQSRPETAAEAGGAAGDQTMVVDSDGPVFESAPFFQSASPSIRLADPALLQSTSSQSRMDTVSAGRPDPFAPVIMPSRLPSRPQAVVATATPEGPQPTAGTAAPTAAAPTAAAPTVSTVPVAATQTLPPLPQASIPLLPPAFVPGSLPTGDFDVTVAPTGSPSLQSLVDQVVISGVVQIGSGVKVIVTEPGTQTSRHVGQGDMLAGGQIRVKSIDMSAQEPVVVLTYGGRDYTRTVGGPLLTSSPT
jgi:hypothetical protein